MRRAVAVAAVAMLFALAPRAHAFQYFDGRLQIHGFFEEQIRGLDKGFSQQFDLAQWYNVLSIETEYDFAPDGWGPFDVLSGYMRTEVRYDCVWTRACGLFSSADAFGNRAAHLPDYKVNGRRTGYSGSVYVGDQQNPNGVYNEAASFTGAKYQPYVDQRSVSANPLQLLTCANGTVMAADPADRNKVRCIAEYANANPNRPAHIDQIDGFTGLFGISGANQQFEGNGDVKTIQVNGLYTALNDDPAFFFFSSQARCKFGERFYPAGGNGVGNQIIGPIDPRCRIDPRAALGNKPNPFNSRDLDPLLVDPVSGENLSGSAELPARPASVLALGDPNPGNQVLSTGVFYPSAAYRNWLRTGKSTTFDQNFSQGALAWNHGGSQQETYELKEAYLDMEFFDSRLWIRLGKQNIVWGKTELFRTTDQFNPQDLALASLPSLEESRIALWSVRGVWSFYDIGPLEDVRLEVAANLDQFEPADIGRCGEPFTALVACNKTTALWAHGLFGIAVAGEQRPSMWWNDPSNLEWGARLEWRTGRFSFQLSDFYGFDDFPYAKRISSFSRNVDANTGRPMRVGSNGGCTTGFEYDCLPVYSNLTLGAADPKANPASPSYSLAANNGNLAPDTGSNAARQAMVDAQPVNLQIFAAICATSIGFNSADPTACGQSVFNSQRDIITFMPQNRDTAKTSTITIASLLANSLAGNPVAALTVRTGFTAGVIPPYVPLNQDPCDKFYAGTCTTTQVPARTGASAFLGGGAGTLNTTLTDQQEALLGCGPYWGTDCEGDGIDLLNAEASAMMQSFIGAEGIYGNNGNFSPGWSYGVTANGVALPQPGTTNFVGGPVATRYVNGRTVRLPGSRGPGDPGYDPNVDGTVAVTGAKWECAGATSLSIPCNDLLFGKPLQDGGFGASAGQAFKSEMAALSFNLQTTLVAFSAPSSTAITNIRAGIGKALSTEFDPDHPYSRAPGQCSFAQPQYCSAVEAFMTVTGTQRNSVRAGGNGAFGRHDFEWQAGGEAILKYQKRNVLGFSLDFAEDHTKTNWGIESTWIAANKFTDNNSFRGVGTSGTINLTISVDRPTFINFLNQNRTFFFNSQVFLQYITNYNSGYTSNGPFNALGTFTVQTGYFQDRLLPSVTFVYDVNSNSGAMLPQISYRFTENFSATIGTNFFFGRFEYTPMAIAPLGTIGTEAGKLAYQDATENGLSVVRERDEAFLRIRYTF